MHAAVTRAWNDIRIEEVPVPELDPGEVLLRVGACGICGTDLKIVSGVYAGSWPPALPFIQGHEWGGAFQPQLVLRLRALTRASSCSQAMAR